MDTENPRRIILELEFNQTEREILLFTLLNRGGPTGTIIRLSLNQHHKWMDEISRD